MIKGGLLSILLIGLQLYLQAQNLVPNPGFEEMNKCPHEVFNMEDCKYWYDPVQSTSDYHHECSTNPSSVGVPQNFIGNQPAHTGQAYVGIAGGTESLCEYVETKLLSPLVAGTKYKVSFWMSRADDLCIASSSIGAFFSKDSLGNCEHCYIEAKPQISFSQPVLDNQGWVKVERVFTATGGENFITIGVFDFGTNRKIRVGTCEFSSLDFYYYYIDDVEVVPLTVNNGQP